MSGTPFQINIPDIHQGTGFLWVNVAIPATGSRLLVDSNGTPQGGAPVSLGSSEGVITVDYEPSIHPIMADQETAEIDAVLVSEKFQIDATLMETAMQKLFYTVATAQFSAGTDSGLPTGAQNYDEITTGGLVVIPKLSVAVISPRRGFSNPTKFMVICGYQMVAHAKLALGVTRTKETTYKVTWSGENITTRPQGDKLMQIYRQT